MRMQYGCRARRLMSFFIAELQYLTNVFHVFHRTIALSSLNGTTLTIALVSNIGNVVCRALAIARTAKTLSQALQTTTCPARKLRKSC